MVKVLILMFVIGTHAGYCQSINFSGHPELFLPSIVSTDKSEIKITFSKDGNLILWGTVGWEKGAGGWDIWQSYKTRNGWSVPQLTSFNSPENDFDPCFSADGKFIYFFSNRPGGFGGDDIYYAQYDSVLRSFGTPVNMGPKFNSAGDEWGPSVSIDGKKFIYCSDGLGGKGKHDVFISNLISDGWDEPKRVDIINSPKDDYDPVFLHDCKTIVFTREISEDEALFFVSFLNENGYSTPMQIDDKMNVPGRWNGGAAIDPTDSSYLYYSTHIQNNTKGKVDVYRIKYKLTIE